MLNRNRSRAPLDGWDPYGDERPGRRNRWAFPRLIRISIPIAVGLLAFGHDILRLFERADFKPTVTSPSYAQGGTSPETAKAPPADLRTMLPRPAKPVVSPASWITSDDYPASALRQSLAGVVKFRFEVSPDGRVRRCIPIATSGSQLLDNTACGVFMLNARYWPARDRNGHAIAQIQTQTVRWQIPKD